MSDKTKAIEWVTTTETSTRNRLRVRRIGSCGTFVESSATRVDLLAACEVAGLHVETAASSLQQSERDRWERLVRDANTCTDQARNARSAQTSRIRDAVERLRESFQLRAGCSMLEDAVEDACAQLQRVAKANRSFLGVADERAAATERAEKAERALSAVKITTDTWGAELLDQPTENRVAALSLNCRAALERETDCRERAEKAEQILRRIAALDYLSRPDRERIRKHLAEVDA